MEITRTTGSERLSVKRLLEQLAQLDESEAGAGSIATGSAAARSGAEEAWQARLRRMKERVGPPQGRGAV